MKKTLLFCAAILPLIVGCSSNNDSGLYFWGQYSISSFEHTQDDITDQEYLDILTEARSEATKKLPPGFLADLGTLYLNMGDANQALTLYRMEGDAWPESAEFMNALIQGINRVQNKQKAVDTSDKTDFKEISE